MNIAQATNAILSRRDCQRRMEYEQRQLDDLENKRKEAEVRLRIAKNDYDAALLREMQAESMYVPETWAKIVKEASPISGM